MALNLAKPHAVFGALASRRLAAGVRVSPAGRNAAGGDASAPKTAANDAVPLYLGRNSRM